MDFATQLGKTKSTLPESVLKTETHSSKGTGELQEKTWRNVSVSTNHAERWVCLVLHHHLNTSGARQCSDFSVESNESRAFAETWGNHCKPHQNSLKRQALF